MDARYTALPHAPATRERQLHQPQAARVLLDSLKEVLTSIFGERCEPWLAALLGCCAAAPPAPLGRAPTPAEVDVLAAEGLPAREEAPGGGLRRHGGSRPRRPAAAAARAVRAAATAADGSRGGTLLRSRRRKL